MSQIHLPDSRILPNSPNHTFRLVSGRLQFSGKGIRIRLLPVLHAACHIIICMVSRHQHKRCKKHFPVLSALQPGLHPCNHVFNGNTSLHCCDIDFMLCISTQRLFHHRITGICRMFGSMPHQNQWEISHLFLQRLPQCFCHILIILRFCQKRIGNCNLLESTGIFFRRFLESVIFNSVNHMGRKYSYMRHSLFFHAFESFRRTLYFYMLALFHCVTHNRTRDSFLYHGIRIQCPDLPRDGCNIFLPGIRIGCSKTHN